jgi:amidase
MNRRRFLASSTAASALATSLVNISSDGAEIRPLCEAALTTCSATELAWLIRHGRVSAERVVTEHIDRIRRVDPVINAVVQKTFDSAMRHAQATDEAIRHGNIDWKRKPLLGVPVTIKDAFDLEGLPTICGVPARQHAPATRDATAVARLKEAGAIVLGKTNVPALCMHFETDNCVFGQTKNPYDVTRTPGGSSGGEAAIIAACGSPLGLGCDGGGSIRTPAHFCGLAGIRPGWGRVSLAGSFPTPPQAYGNYYTAGPLARCVEDLALALDVLSGQDPRDPFTFPVPLLDYRDVSIPDVRVCYWTECERADTTAETQHTVRQAAEALHAAGAHVRKRRPPHWGKTGTILNALYDTEVTTFETMLKTFGIDEPQSIDLQAVEYARKHWGQISPERSKQAIEQWLPMFQIAMLELFEEYDAMLLPVSATPAVCHGGTWTNVYNYDYTLATSMIPKVPAGSIRCGWSPELLPIGVQVVVKPYREDIALAIMQRLEGVFGGWRAPAEKNFTEASQNKP